jgi:hypothetical protein
MQVEFNPSTTAIVVTSLSSSYIYAYPWSGTGFGTKYANPTTPPTGGSRGIAYNAAGTDIAVSCDASPFILVYPWSGGFGTKYANPATLPTGGSSSGVAFRN